MCIAVPGRVKGFEGKKLIIDYGGEERRALAGDEPVKVGNYVMVQMGIVVKILSSKEAKAVIGAWTQK